MRKIKYMIFVVLLFIVIGFATMSVSLSIEGVTDLIGDIDNFNVYYSNVYVNGEENFSVLKSATELDFNVTLRDPGETYTIAYDVTNASNSFDAKIVMSCTGGSGQQLSVVNDFDTSTNLGALETRTGTLTIKKLKAILSYTPSTSSISCTITASPVEIDHIVEGIPVEKKYAMLEATNTTDITKFRADEYKMNIKTITFEDEINIPDDAIEYWDIGIAQNGNVMAYLVTNKNNPFYYDLYIQSNSTLYANRNMSSWFRGMKNLEAINNLDLLNTSGVTDMSGMFYSVGYNSNILSFDVSNFDTSNVTNMSNMFGFAGFNSSDFILDVSNFDTSKVTNMSYMFQYAGSGSKTFILDVSNFDTSKVTNMSNMFYTTGYYGENFTLDVSNFDTSNVTNMYNMFSYAGYYSKNFTLDVSNFDTSKVTNMGYMFSYAGYSSEIFTIDLGDKFDTSKVTNMNGMFNNAGYNSTKLNTSITIRNPNVTSYGNMFVNVATKEGSQITVNYTSDTSSLVDKMINTKSASSNVVKGELFD